MSEELRARGYLNDGEVRGSEVGPYEGFILGNTTLNQLSKAGLIEARNFGRDGNRCKPDGLVIDRRGNTPRVLLVVEHKDRGELDTEDKRDKVFNKAADVYCKTLSCDLVAITDSVSTWWASVAEDGTWVPITRDDGFLLDHPAAMHDRPSRRSLDLTLGQIFTNIDRETGHLSPPVVANPEALADQTWQTVWLASGADPDACLATFIEVLLFKFLSDLGVLSRSKTGVLVGFDHVRSLPNDQILVYYADHVRTAMKDLFPPSAVDGTSVINGTVLDPQNRDHGRLFALMLKDFAAFGSLRRINPEFKSRIFERFLRNTISQKNWGQFFTPRNVVKAIVEMSEIDTLAEGSIVCDPACGVGGFLLEPLINKRPLDFRGGPSLRYKGMDRDQKTIILAKANMLIHLSEMLESDPVGAVEILAQALNDTFHSMASAISGSLAEAPKEEYDLVLSNPPYVVSGTTQQKEMLSQNATLAEYYNTSSMGVEGLFMQMIVKGLKPGGRAFVVVPDGMLFRHGDKALREFILRQCTLEAVVSLPRDTFYTTSKKTYILALRKKEEHQRGTQQIAPVFTYLVGAVGETLDANRFPIADNHLLPMASLFEKFVPNPHKFVPPEDLRCRVYPVTNFTDCESWIIEHWWSDSELKELGHVDDLTTATPDELADRLKATRSRIKVTERLLRSVPDNYAQSGRFRQVRLSDADLFRAEIGKRVTKKNLRQDIKPGPIPLYSANVLEPFAMVEKSLLSKEAFNNPSVLWGIDGDFMTVAKQAGEIFSITDHCGRLEILDPTLDVDYVAAALFTTGARKFNREFRPSLKRLGEVVISVPVDEYGNFDLKAQQELASRFHSVRTALRDVKEMVEDALNVIPTGVDV